MTNALQTFNEDGIEKCGFYNGHDGMFLTKGTMQYTAEMLYNISNDIKFQSRQQHGTVNGDINRTVYSPLSKYQYNGNIFDLLVHNINLSWMQVLGLAYKKDGREKLKKEYENLESNYEGFDELMNDLEKIYSMDNLLLNGHEEELQSEKLIDITMKDGVTKFKGNLNSYRKIMDKTEIELAIIFLKNHNNKYILEHYNLISLFLTNPKFKKEFISEIKQYRKEILEKSNVVNVEEHKIMLSRMNEDQDKEYPINNSKVNFKQKLAQFMNKNNLFMNVGFVNKFVLNQLNISKIKGLHTLDGVDENNVNIDEDSKDFIDELKKIEEDEDLSLIQRNSDFNKIIKIESKRRKEQNKDENDRV